MLNEDFCCHIRIFNLNSMWIIFIHKCNLLILASSANKLSAILTVLNLFTLSVFADVGLASQLVGKSVFYKFCGTAENKDHLKTDGCKLMCRYKTRSTSRGIYFRHCVSHSNARYALRLTETWTFLT